MMLQFTKTSANEYRAFDRDHSYFIKGRLESFGEDHEHIVWYLHIDGALHSKHHTLERAMDYANQ